MHPPTEDNNDLLFKYAVLSARLEIREFFLKYAVREVYENIGQVLSLVRIQLASFDTQELLEKPEDIVQSGNLVGQSIRDLRSMCRSFYPDKDLLKDGGFVEGINLTIKTLQLSANPAVAIKGKPAEMPEGFKLITYNILLDILMIIKGVTGIYKNLAISYTDKEIVLTVRYNGKVDWQVLDADQGTNDNLTIRQRVNIIRGQFNVKRSKNGLTSLILKVPLNISQ